MIDKTNKLDVNNLDKDAQAQADFINSLDDDDKDMAIQLLENRITLRSNEQYQADLDNAVYALLNQ
jgi:hypothetical protein